MGTNLTINNKQLILDLPASFEIDHNAFKGEQRIATMRALGAKWFIQSDTVDVSLDAQGRFLKYSILSNITDSQITHIVTYTNVITSEVFSIDIIQRAVLNFFKPYKNYGFFTTADYHVFEVEFEKTNGFDLQIILDHSDISLTNGMFSIHSIVQKTNPIVRIQILKSNLSEHRETDLTLTLNGVHYTKHIITDIDPKSLIRPLSRDIQVIGNVLHTEEHNTQIQCSEDITYKCASSLVYPIQGHHTLRVIVEPNRSFEPKIVDVSAYVKQVKIQDVKVEVKAGVYPVKVTKVLNAVDLHINVSERTMVKILETEYIVGNKSYKVDLNEDRLYGQGGISRVAGTIVNKGIVLDGGRFTFLMKIGKIKKHFSININ